MTGNFASDNMSPLVNKESLLAKLTATFGGQTGLFLFGTAVQIVVSRALGPSGKGLFSLTLLSANTLVILAHGSLSAANSHFMGRFPDARRALVGNSFLLALVWGAIVALVAYFFIIVQHVSFVPDLGSRLWLIALAAIIPLMLLEFSHGLVMGLDWIRRFSLTLLLTELLVFVGVALLWWMGKLTVLTAVLVWFSARTICAFLQAGSAWWRVGWRIAISFHWFKRVTRFILQAHVANVFSFLKQRIDMFIIAYYLTAQDVGYYSIAFGMLMVLWYLPTAISQVLIPHISWRDNQAGDQLTPKLSRFGFSISVICAVLIASLGWLLIKIMFGEAFLPAYPALLLLLPGGIIYTLAKMMAGDLIGRGLPKYAMWISIFAFVGNVVINLILIPKFGIVGAAIASSITHGFTGSMFFYAFKRESGIRTLDALLVTRSDIQEVIQAVRRNRKLDIAP